MENIIELIMERIKEPKIINIANTFGLKYNNYTLKKLKKNLVNAFEISNNLIYFYPLNDGFPTCRFAFYKNGELVLDNNKEYSQITNLDEIILQMVRIFNQALDREIVLNPYCFMLELTDKVCKDYQGKANLIITNKAIINPKLNVHNFAEANKYFINQFLDHFIGWNFGVSVNRSEILKQELEELNSKVINMGIREYAGTGFEVYGTTDEVKNGLQHYELPTEKIRTRAK